MIWAQPQQDATDDGDLADRWVELREEEITPVLLGKNEKRIRAHIKTSLGLRLRVYFNQMTLPSASSGRGSMLKERSGPRC